MNKKIALISPTLLTGGAERVITILANNFINEGLEVVIILMFRRPIEYEVSNKVKIVEPEFNREGIPKMIYVLKLIIYLFREIRKVKPRGIISFQSGYNLISILCNAGQYPLIISDRSSPIKKKKRLQQILERILYPKADGLIAQTIKAKEHFLNQKLNKNIKVIYNPIKHIRVQRNQEKKNIILNVGRLVWEKNQIELVKIFKSIPTKGWELMIVGKGPLKRELQEEIAGYPSIHLITDNVDIEYYYNISKIYAMTSISEGYPNTLCEAMSAGLACISYNCVAGPNEIINNSNNGYLIDLNNNKDYREKLYKLMKNQQLRDLMGNNAISKMKNYSDASQAKKYLNFVYEI
ncbi:MAG: glycosyltransferase [Flavobacteriaceae bacterium]|nr:glycosyltransferase [Flavobacteriaceae bacterium]